MLRAQTIETATPRSDYLWLNLGLASFVALYFELLIIRYLTTEIRTFTNLKNLPLVACFFGIGLGMILGRPSKRLRRIFPFITFLLLVLTRFASSLHLVSGDVSWTYGLSQPQDATALWRVIYAARLAGTVLGFSALIITFFSVIGGFVGEGLRTFRL